MPREGEEPSNYMHYLGRFKTHQYLLIKWTINIFVAGTLPRVPGITDKNKNKIKLKIFSKYHTFCSSCRVHLLQLRTWQQRAVGAGSRAWRELFVAKMTNKRADFVEQN